MSTHECGVCWNVYDSAEGDSVAQVPPGTPFDALPEDWRCPRCDSPKARYLPTRDDAPAAAAGVPPPVPVVDPRVVALVAAYRTIAETRMKGLPIVNPRLSVEAVGFQSSPAGLVGALVTPWSINAVLFPLSGVAPVDGHQRALPGGSFRFLPQRLEEVGYLELSSLFSPVFQFDGQAAAVAAAEQALRPLLTAPAPAPAPEAASEAAEAPPPAVAEPRSRRDLFRLLRRGPSHR